MHIQTKPFLKVIDGEACFPPPVWLMRQAGRYLPEYQALRAKSRSFLEFCYTPALAAEATMQPIRRFGFDAAILFSDILVIPDALGQKVAFEPNEGPKLDPIVTAEDVRQAARADRRGRLSPVFETIERVKTALPAANRVDWLLRRAMDACLLYDRRQKHTRSGTGPSFCVPPTDLFQKLIDRLVEASIDYLALTDRRWCRGRANLRHLGRRAALRRV